MFHRICCLAAIGQLLFLGSSYAYVENIHDLENLKDTELLEIFNNPYGDPAKIPGEDRPGEYVHCVGLPIINALSNYSETIPNNMPFGKINPFTRWYGNWWNGKVLMTDNRGKTRGWNLLYTNNSVALTTDVYKANQSVTGNPRPVVILNYTNTEEIWGRAYLDEMRQVGPNTYLVAGFQLKGEEYDPLPKASCRGLLGPTVLHLGRSTKVAPPGKAY